MPFFGFYLFYFVISLLDYFLVVSNCNQDICFSAKKASLADVGVVGGLRDNSATASAYMGQSMGIGLGPSGTTHAGIFTSPAAGNSSFSSFGQQQFGNFK